LWFVLDYFTSCVGWTNKEKMDRFYCAWDMPPPKWFPFMTPNGSERFQLVWMYAFGIPFTFKPRLLHQ